MQRDLVSEKCFVTETVHSSVTPEAAPTPPHFKYVILLQPKVPCAELDAFARLRLDGVDALVVVAVVTGVVWREEHPLHASHGRAAFS